MTIRATISRMSTAANDGGYTVTRTAQGTIDQQGNYTNGAVTQFALTPAVIQPSSGKNLAITPSGNFATDVIAIACHVQLHTEDAEFKPDVIRYRGRDYAVVKVEWPIWLNGESHCEAYATKQGAS